MGGSKNYEKLVHSQKNITIEILVLCPFLPELIYTDSFNLAWVDENHWFIWNCPITLQPHFTMSALIVIVWDKDTKYAVWYLICGVNWFPVGSLGRREKKTKPRI